VLLALAAVALLAGGALLFAQHSRTGTTSLAVQVDPADLLAIQSGTTVSLKIRLGTGPAYLWGDSTNTCTSPIANATTISTSGTYSSLLSAVPFIYNNYVCVYSPSTLSLTTYVAWPHTPASLAFSQQPSNTASGASISPAVTVQVLDSNGIVYTGSTASVAIAIKSGTGTSGATLSGTLTQSAVNGVATFNNLSINDAGNNYQLQATSGSLTVANSATFNITSGTATQVRVETAANGSGTVVPAQNVASGSTLTVYAISRDASNNFVANVTATWSLSNVTGGVVAGDLSPTSGTSTTLTGHKVGTAQIQAVASFTGTSGTLTIVPGAVSALVSTVSANPTSVIADGTTTSTITVTLMDANSNPVSGKTVTLTAGSGSSTISAASGSSSATGVVTFTVKDSTAQSVIYTGKDTTDSVTVTQTATVTFTADKLVFTTQPGGGTGGTAWGTQPVVKVETSGGTTVTTGANSTASITLAITSGTPTSGGPGTLACTANPKNAIAGVDTFAGCKINLVGTGYTLTATSSGLGTATSSAFNITTGAVSASVSTVTASPTSVLADGATTSTITVTLNDAGGNPVTGKAVSLTAGSGSSTISAASGSSTATGVVTFTVTDAKAQQVTYTAKDTTDSVTISQTATVTFTASKLVFTTSPISVTAGVCSPQITVQTQDGSSNPTDPPSAVTVALSSNSTGTKAFYSNSGCSTSISSVSIATSANTANFYYKDTKAGSPVITAAATGGVTSSPTQTETVNAGTVSASVSTVTASPTSVPADGSTTSTVTVTLLDVNSNPVSGKTVTLTAGSGSSTISAASGSSTAAGVVTFTVKDNVAQQVTYTAKDTTDSVTISQTATVTFTASKLVFTTQPGGGTGGTAWTMQPKVTVEDGAGNTVTSSSALITLTPSSGTLTCTTNPLAASSGVATFAGCNINKSGTGYTLTATSSGLTSATSSAFNITVGSAAQVAFTTQPGGGTAGTAWSQQPVVTLQDAGGNTVTGTAQTVTLAIQNNPGSGTLTCTGGLSKATTTGVATFAGCSISSAGTGYTLTVTGSTVDTTAGVVVSSAFNIT